MTALLYFESESLNHLILKATVPLATLFKPAVGAPKHRREAKCKNSC